MDMLEKFIARQAEAVIEKTDSTGPVATWRVDFDITADEVGGDDSTTTGYVSEVAAPDAQTAIYLALMEIVALAVEGTDQATIMRRTAEQIREQFGEAGESA